MLPVTITSIKQAFRGIKNFGCTDWGREYRTATWKALREILESQMHNTVDAYLHQMHSQGLPDRRNGSYSRHLLTELGDLELSIPPYPNLQPIFRPEQGRGSPLGRYSGSKHVFF